MIRLLIAAVLLVLPAMAQVSDNFSGTLSNWTTYSGTWVISGGKLTQTAVGNTITLGKQIHWHTPASTPNCYVQAKIWKDATDTASTNLVARFTDNGADTCTYYMATVRNSSASTDSIQLYKYSGTCTGTGTAHTQLGSTVSEEWTDGDTLRFELNGSTLNVYRNGVLKIGPITDETQAVAGKVGFRVGYNAGGSFDDFESSCMSPAAAGQLLNPIKL